MMLRLFATPTGNRGLQKLRNPPFFRAFLDNRVTRRGEVELSSPVWFERVAARLGIDLTPRPRGRPTKEVSASVIGDQKMK